MSLPPLSPEQMVKPRAFELRISLLFATLFIPMGIHAPYFPLWLEFEGFRPEEIAVILSAPLFFRVLTTPIITSLADKARDRADVYIACVAATLMLSFGYFLQPTYAIVLAVSLAISIVWTPQSPLVDALALSGVRRFGSQYPLMRSVGSFAFLCSNLAGGMILARTGAGFIPWMITGSLVVTLIAGFAAPRLGRPRVASPLSAAVLQKSGPALFNPYFLFFVAGAGVINASHGYMFAFISIYWKSLGIGDTMIGLLWAFAVLCEVVLLLLFTRLFANTRAPTLLVLAAVCGIVRWAAVPLIWVSGIGVAGFFATQALHAFSTGLVIAGVQKLIAEVVSEEKTGAAQGIAFFANGFSMAAATLASGAIYERLGGDGFYVMSGVATLGLLLVLLARALSPERRLGR